MKYGECEEIMFRAEYPCASLEIAHQRAAEQRKDIISKGWKIISEKFYQSPEMVAVHFLAQRPKEQQNAQN